MKVIFNILIMLLTGLYIANLTAGFIEFIPDNIPLFGNLDEATAGIIFWASFKSIISSFKGSKK